MTRVNCGAKIAGMAGTPAGRPARKYPGIAAVKSGGRWRWRACVRVHGQQLVGPLVDDQRVAFADAERLREEARRPRSTATIRQCIDLLVRRAEERGLEPHSVHGVWRSPGRAILRYFADECAMEAITADVVRGFVVWCLEGDPRPDRRGRPTRKPVKPQTVRKEYLRVLHQAFGAAGLPSPIPAVKVDLARQLRTIPPVVVGFEVEESAGILAQIRAWKGRLPAPNQQLDLLFVSLIATTGLRASELARVRARDVLIDQAAIVVHPKSRGHPRVEPIVPDLLEDVRARLAQLKGPDDPFVPARGTPSAYETWWHPNARYLARMVVRWQSRLGESRFHLRAMRRAHGTGLDAVGSRYAVIRDGLGHSRTSDETPRYLTAAHREVTAAKTRLAERLLRPQGRAGAERDGEGPDGAPTSGDAPGR